MRLVTLGDSITGVTNDYAFCWPPFLTIPLTHNAGIGGDSTGGMLARLSTDVLAYGPTDVTILGGTNDVGAGVPTATILSNLGAIIDGVRAAGANAWLMTVPPNIVYGLPADTLALNAALPALAVAHGAHLIDIWTLLAASDNGYLPGYSADGIHANTLSAPIIAGAVQGALVSYPRRLLLESGAGGYLLEDGSGVLTLEDGTGPTGVHPAAGNAVGYVVELFAPDANWGPGVKLCELSGVRNLGWSQYDRLAAKAFFTLSQNDPNLQYIVRNKTHIAITRIVGSVITRVYSGQVVDYTSNADDVVITCTDYIGLLSLSRCGYRTMYTTKKLGSEIVANEWYAATTPANSILGFVAWGAIEDPLGIDGTTPITTDTQFGLLDQSRLRLFYDLSEMGRANTSNIVTFGITRNPPHAFFFSKNAGTSRDLALALNGRVVDYSYSPNWSSYRNDFATLAQDANGGAAEIVSKDDAAAVAEGRRQDIFNIGTLLGLSTGTTTTENSQQKAAVDRVLARGLNPLPSLALQLDEGSFNPFVGNELNDRFPVEIVHGIDNIHAPYRFAGVQAFFDNSGEKMTVEVVP